MLQWIDQLLSADENDKLTEVMSLTDPKANVALLQKLCYSTIHCFSVCFNMLTSFSLSSD